MDSSDLLSRNGHGSMADRQRVQPICDCIPFCKREFEFKEMINEYRQQNFPGIGSCISASVHYLIQQWSIHAPGMVCARKHP